MSDPRQMAKRPKKSLTAEEMFGAPIVEAAKAVVLAKTRQRRPSNNPKIVEQGAPFRWKPGQSGNPNGRPRSTTEMKQAFAGMTDLAKEIIGLSGEIVRLRLQRVRDILVNPADATDEEIQWALAQSSGSIDAAQAILDRGHGKPVAKVEIDPSGYFDELSDDELEAVVLDMSSKAVAEIAGKRKAKRDV
jgi:uncharacterized protein DUF5681